MSTEISFDAFPPPGMAAKAEGVGVKKAGLDFLTMFALAILAGAFIGVGAIFATTVLAGTSTLPYGVARLLGGLVFTTGLILVVVGGAELFTGNNLIVMAFASRKVTLGGLLRNWGDRLRRQLRRLDRHRLHHVPEQAVHLWQRRGRPDRVEHRQRQDAAWISSRRSHWASCATPWCAWRSGCASARAAPPTRFWRSSRPSRPLSPPALSTASPTCTSSRSPCSSRPTRPGSLRWAIKDSARFANLTWGNFFIANLLPVTIGNIIGGAGMVGLVYWFAYLRTQPKS